MKLDGEWVCTSGTGPLNLRPHLHGRISTTALKSERNLDGSSPLPLKVNLYFALVIVAHSLTLYTYVEIDGPTIVQFVYSLTALPTASTFGFSHLMR
jgi:hypothetical protein